VGHTTCPRVDKPIEWSTLASSARLNAVADLTAVIKSRRFKLREAQVPPMKFTVRLVFSNGEESIARVETPGIQAEPAQVDAAPYRLAEATSPDEPILVSSSNFVQMG
jgi:hypothetical protein